MTLDELKQAAFRLRNQSTELGFLAEASVTHSKALDIVSKLHGFRHYHEAQQRLSNTSNPESPTAVTTDSVSIKKASAIVAEVGGCISLKDGTRFDLSALAWPPGVEFLVEGPSGCGKTLMAKEIICQALAQGTQVRILDMNGSYRHFAFALGGQHFYGVDSLGFQEAWNSNAPLVVVDCESSKFVWDQLRGLPTDALFVMEDGGGLKRAELGVRTLRVIPDYFQEDMTHAIGARHQGRTSGKWQLRLSPKVEWAPVQFSLSATRNDTYFSRM